MTDLLPDLDDKDFRRLTLALMRRVTRIRAGRSIGDPDPDGAF